MVGPQRSPPAVLAVSSHLPWPLDRGGHIRSFHLLKALASEARVRLVAGAGHLSGVIPQPFADAGIRVSPAGVSDRSTWREGVRAAAAALRGQPYLLYHRHNRQAMWSTLRDELAREAPAAVYLDHLDSWLYSGLFHRVPRVIDLHNVYSRIVEREWPTRRGVARLWMRREARLLAHVEHRVASQASTVFAVSRQECDYYAGLGAKTVLVDNGVDCPAYAALPTGRRNLPPLVLYVGTMSWPPNASAAVFLARDALPRVQSVVAGTRLRIIGRDPGPDVLALRGLPGVEVTGGVEDVRPHLAEATALAVPLDVGGGTRLKILEAFAAGLPVVSSAIGCEGLEVHDDTHLLIAERAQFAERLQTLLDDRDRAAAMAERARELARARYDWAVIGRTAANAVTDVIDRAAAR
jgi:glycosyltransferase involved in cell wall biosynthesis